MGRLTAGSGIKNKPYIPISSITELSEHADKFRYRIVGVPEEISVGSMVASLGFPFGYYGIYNQVIKQAVISAKVLSGNETQIFLFDTMVHDGHRGGPLINLADGRIIGVIGGRFSPQELMPDHLKSAEAPIKTDISYAVSTDHARDLMEAESIDII
jgi:serine protease Do